MPDVELFRDVAALGTALQGWLENMEDKREGERGSRGAGE